MAAAPAQQVMMPYNEEGKVLDPALPSSWTLEKLRNGELPIRIFGDLPSPSNQRIRFLLKFYKIPFTQTFGAYTKVDKTYPYKKMPVMRVGKPEDAKKAHETGDPEVGRFINDGYSMINAFAPIFQGRPFTEEEIELEKILTFGHQYPFIAAAVKEGKCGCMAGTMVPQMNCCMKCCFNCCMGCCCPYCCCPCCCNETCCKGGKATALFEPGAKEQGVFFTRPMSLKSFKETGTYMANKLGDKQYFAGDEYGLIDVDLFGLYHHNLERMKMKCAKAMIDADPRLRAWYDRMNKVAGHVDCFSELQFKKANE